MKFRKTIIMEREPGDPFLCDLCNAEIAGQDGMSVMSSYLVDSSLYCPDCYDLAGHGVMERIYPACFDLTKARFVRENRSNTIKLVYQVKTNGAQQQLRS